MHDNIDVQMINIATRKLKSRIIARAVLGKPKGNNQGRYSAQSYHLSVS